jgi:hypothetical protein
LYRKLRKTCPAKGEGPLKLNKGRFAVLVLALAAGACAIPKNYLDPDAPKYAGNYTPPGKEDRQVPPESPFRAVTFNISYSRHIDRALQVLRESEPLRNFDALALQEMDAPGADRIAR